MPPIEVIPSAKRLIRSLRDMGYDITQAVADIVDNSVEARATRVDIDIEFEGDNSWLRITDNGRGMTPDQLREAMRYGAERDYDPDDLGKFGLGLKTASMSQCQVLSVASRWNPDRADIVAYAWDLDHIERTNRWEILPLDRNGVGPALFAPLREGPGTVVLWERLDRILGFKHPYGEAARKRLSLICRDIERHLGMVFHKFIDGAVRGRKLIITVNGNQVKSWDPYCLAEPKTTVLTPMNIEVDHEGVSGEVLIEPFILPHQSEFSSPEAFNAASGPANWNQQQGFYIYRAGRLIQSGGWSNLRSVDEHTKLARIAVSFAPKLDEAFKINVAKMRVQLPAQIRDDVREAIAPIVKLARQVYDRKQTTALRGAQSGNSTVAENATGPSARSRSISGVGEKAPGQGVGRSLCSLEEWTARMLAAATRGERTVIERVARRVGAAKGAQ